MSTTNAETLSENDIPSRSSLGDGGDGDINAAPRSSRENAELRDTHDITESQGTLENASSPKTLENERRPSTPPNPKFSKFLSTSSLKRRRVKPVHCRYCCRFRCTRDQIEQHFLDSEICLRESFKKSKKKSKFLIFYNPLGIVVSGGYWRHRSYIKDNTITFISKKEFSIFIVFYPLKTQFLFCSNLTNGC